MWCFYGSFCGVAFVFRTPPLDLLLQLHGSRFFRLLEVPDVGINSDLHEVTLHKLGQAIGNHHGGVDPSDDVGGVCTPLFQQLHVNASLTKFSPQ